MPYWITEPGQTADCAGWATVKEVAGDLQVIGCHQLKQEAIAQAVAIALSEGDESLFMGEYGKEEDSVEQDAVESNESVTAVELREDEVVEDEQGDEVSNRFLPIAEALITKLWGETRSKEREIRTLDINPELRAIDETGMRFSGYAAIFNSASRDLGGFVEFIKPGAFARSLASRNKIMLLWNHDTSAPLASTRNGSLVLREDERGLFVEATLPDTTLGRDIAAQVRSGLTDSMSFGFQVKRDSWNTRGDQRTLEDVALFEVSLVTSEAYAATAGTVSVRNYVATAEKNEIDAELLADAMNDFEQGNELSAEKAGVIQAVLEKLTASTPEETVSPELLAIKRKQFELLLKELKLG